MMRLIALAAAIFAVSMGQPPAVTTPPIRLAVNMTTVESAPVFLAAQGAAAEMTLVSGGIPLLVDRTAEAATNAETQALLRSVANPEVRIVMTVAESWYRIVGRRSAGIQRLSDLRGKRVAAPLNTSAGYYLSKMLQTVQLREADVTVVSTPVPDMPAALKRGDVDAIAVWEPGPEDAIAALGADAIVFQDRSVYRELFNLNTTAAVLNDPARRRALVAVVRAIVAASGDVTARPSGVWPLLSSRINVPPSTIEKVWPHFRFPVSLPSDLLPVMVDEEQWVAAAQKRAPRGRAQLQTLVDDTVLRDARRSPR
jgi:NitT/TauT family transport system substrate-binding protein